MRVATPGGTFEAVEVRILPGDYRFSYRVKDSSEEWATASYDYVPGVSNMPFLRVEADGAKMLLVHVRERGFGADIFTVPAGNMRNDVLGFVMDSVHRLRVRIEGPADISVSVSELRPGRAR